MKPHLITDIGVGANIMKHAWEQLLKDRGYVIQETLGEGAYSKVVSAFSSELGQDVAIKCINFKGAPKDFVEKFLPRELRTLPLLSHDNIVQVYEVLEHYDKNPNGSYVCIVMELARNGDMLKHVQKHGALHESDVKHYFWQLAKAVKYCHDRDICHRDLKCENLLLSRNHRLILSDFGFCKPMSFHSDGKVILSSTFCGSAAYAAPETLQGKPYDPRKHDMWSMGVVLYIMTTGQMPFDDTNVGRMLKFQLRNKVRFPSRIRGMLSSKLKDLIRLLLEVDVDQRGTIYDVFSHPFYEGYHEESLGRFIYRKIFDFFTGGRFSEHADDGSEKQPCCSRGLNKSKTFENEQRKDSDGHPDFFYDENSKNFTACPNNKPQKTSHRHRKSEKRNHTKQHRRKRRKKAAVTDVYLFKQPTQKVLIEPYPTTSAYRKR